jgi:hypothetical protein
VADKKLQLFYSSIIWTANLYRYGCQGENYSGIIPSQLIMKVIMEIVCECVYSGISETNNIAALATTNAGINGHGHKRENPAFRRGIGSLLNRVNHNLQAMTAVRAVVNNSFIQLSIFETGELRLQLIEAGNSRLKGGEDAQNTRTLLNNMLTREENLH